MRIKRKVQRLSIWLTYHLSCLHSYEHSMERFRSEFHLHEEIGRGGFGVVYRGFRVEDGAPVAVKFVAHKYVREWIQHSDDMPTISAKTKNNLPVINKSRLKRRKYGQLVPAEMRYLKECADLDGVVNLVDWFASPKGFLMVMERPNNCMDLFDVISVYGRLDEEIARQIFQQIVHTVVELLHKYSIVHRDIKDENVIVDMETGAIRLVDFGAADYLEMARFKDFQGTKSYCPPEWFKRNCYLPLESTVWSLGILLYIMLTGNNPFRNEIQICVGRLKFPDYVSLKSQDLIKQCLNPSPERRLPLEEILKHKFFCSPVTDEKRSMSKSVDINVDSGQSSASSSFRQRTLGNSRRPFHALLHRRSMRRRRRRDCDNNLVLPDEFDSESSSEAECSYRQSMKVDLKDQPAPITVPQYAIDAAAQKKLRRQETNENSVYFTTDELDEISYKITTPKMQESSSGFETAAEEQDEWLTLPADVSQCDNLTESYMSCSNPISKLRRHQLLQIHDQKRIDSRAQLIAGISQSSYKSAVSQIILERQDDASIVSQNFSSSSGAGTSEDEDEAEESESKTANNLTAKSCIEAIIPTKCNEEETTDQSSINLYFSAIEEGATALCSQPSTDFWSASDFDNDNADQTLRNDISNSLDVTIIVDDDDDEEENASANDAADVVSIYEPGFLGMSLDSERGSATPTLLDTGVSVTPGRSATPHSCTFSPVHGRISTPEILTQKHSAKPNTLSPPMHRRPRRRLSRRLRDAARHTPSRVDSRSSSSDSFVFDCPTNSQRRERSMPCMMDSGIQLTATLMDSSCSDEVNGDIPRKVFDPAQSGSRYRRRWRSLVKPTRCQQQPCGQSAGLRTLDALESRLRESLLPDNIGVS